MSLKETLKQTPIYGAYARLLKPYRDRRIIRNAFWEINDDDLGRIGFYKRFIAPGDTVFDVGANVGNRVKLFVTLGAKVIAVEPQEACVSDLRIVTSGRDVVIVPKALGDKPGTATMKIANASTLSSLSDDFIAATKESGRFAEYEWNRTQEVEITTLDALIREYGKPSFVKIDVEGFELQVLSGLSVPVRALSIEFTPETIVTTFACIDKITSLGNYEFQLSLGESLEFNQPEWMNLNQIKSLLSAVPASEFGDVYMRLKV